MKIAVAICCICFGLLVMVSFTKPSNPGVGVETAIDFFKTRSITFAKSASQLEDAIAMIDSNDRNTILNAREALKHCRLNYKSIEFFLAYFFKSSALIYNGAPKYEIEEPFMEYQEPIGLQVVEGLLFEKNAAARKDELLQQADAISSSAKDLNALLFGFQADDKQLLESVRLQLIRIITLGITGFDAPLLKSGIAEAEASLSGLHYVLQPFLSNGDKQADSVSKYLSGSLWFVGQSKDFDQFDRPRFLTQYALPLQRHLGLLIKELKLDYNTTGGVLNYDAPGIFSPDAIDIRSFPSTNNKPDAALTASGKKLFFETALSGNNKISCATCHDPAKLFTDGQDKSIAFDGHSRVDRNAPSLLYAGFQYEQFWDGRAKSLEEQIRTVISNPKEMNGGQAKDEVVIALAAFVRQLNPRNSRFDQYIQGMNNTFNPKEINGFNLFMGKAQCGTCHFAPLFNGLVPPLYNLSELEVLGTTKTDDFNKPELDSDRGRFDIFPIEFYEKAFKTPTVRNTSATGPYMHNGSFKTLESVVEFYNKGGANGLGLQVSNQTLSSIPLNLSKTEVSDIVSFLGALKDSITIR